MTTATIRDLQSTDTATLRQMAAEAKADAIRLWHHNHAEACRLSDLALTITLALNGR